MAFSEFEQLASSTLLAQTGLLVIASDAAGRIALLSPGMQELFELPFEPVPEDEISARFRAEHYARRGNDRDERPGPTSPPRQSSASAPRKSKTAPSLAIGKAIS